MSILSVQSWVAAGHVGNAAALLPLNRLGFEVWPVNTVAFSNHPAHGTHTGRTTPAADVRALLDGLAARGLFADCRAVLSGYLGEAATGPALLEAVHRVKAARPDSVYCCDPVFGDAGRVFVAADLVTFFRDKALDAADILTPNAFEASCLAGRPISGIAEAASAADALRLRGPRTVVVTGVAADAAIATVAVEGGQGWVVETPRLDAAAHGAGDLFAALFLGHRLLGRATPEALQRAVSGVYAVVAASGISKDLALVAAQAAMLDPPVAYPVRRLDYF